VSAPMGTPPDRPSVVVDRRMRPWVKTENDRRATRDTGRRASDPKPYADPWSNVGPRD
jgi:hypothetical protein